jgi:hypothetical protein
LAEFAPIQPARGSGPRQLARNIPDVTGKLLVIRIDFLDAHVATAKLLQWRQVTGEQQ